MIADVANRAGVTNFARLMTQWIRTRLYQPGFDVARQWPRAAAISVSLLFASLALAVANLAPSIGWQLEAGKARELLAVLLTAQAAIVALTFIVAIFALEIIATQRNAKERLYRKYVRRAGLDWFLPSSVSAVGVTVVFLIAEAFGSGGSPSLVIAAALIAVASLALPVALFERVRAIARPSAEGKLQQEANLEDVGAALRQKQDRRADPDAGSVDDVIQRLVADARRAVDEHRQEDVEGTFDTVWQLIEYALSEAESAEGGKGEPRLTAGWLSLFGLRENFYPLREHVISQGQREGVSLLDTFDYRLRTEGITRRREELFTVALDGYEDTYAIASRVGNDAGRAWFRQVFWSTFRFTVGLNTMDPDESFPYMKRAALYQERLLSLALHGDLHDDFKALSQEFAGVLEECGARWGAEQYPLPETAHLHAQLEQRVRIALMGLGGRALQLAQQNKVNDPQPYLDVVRAQYSSPETLAKDMAVALDLAETLEEGVPLWREWESEGIPSLTVYSLNPARYPLAFFVLRLLELASAPLPALSLQGGTQRVSGWSTEHLSEVEGFVKVPPGETLEALKQHALSSLGDTVQSHEIAREEDIIRRPLSSSRIRDFKEGVRQSISENGATERLFTQAEALSHLGPEDASAPEPRGFNHFLTKDAFTDQPTTGPFRDLYVANYETHLYGVEIEHDVRQQFSEALSDAPVIEVPLDTPDALLQAIDGALADLTSASRAIVLLTGEWREIRNRLVEQSPARYEPWRGEDNLSYYRGHPILYPFNPPAGDRRVYVVEPGTWGSFLRAQFDDGTDLRVDIKPIDPAQAQELLGTNPNLFPDESNATARLRKIQTLVRCIIAVRSGFRVTDPTRARLIRDPAAS